eukprot:scaffold63372_cov75-Phaeocystis_antarctica.AAC.1
MAVSTGRTPPSVTSDRPMVQLQPAFHEKVTFRKGRDWARAGGYRKTGCKRRRDEEEGVLVVFGGAERVRRSVFVRGPCDGVVRAGIAGRHVKAADAGGRELRATVAPHVDSVADGRGEPIAVGFESDSARRTLEADVGEGLEDLGAACVSSRDIHRRRECDHAVVSEGRVDKRLGAEHGGLIYVEHVLVRAVRVGRGGPRVGEALIPVRAGAGGIELSHERGR